MSFILSEIDESVLVITFNRVDKNNAFNEIFLAELLHLLEEAQHDPAVRVILIRAQGPHFSAGADLEWMQRMAQLTEEENIADALVLARIMATLHHSLKPTIAAVQGAAFGGGAGIIAACDVGIAAQTAQFSFSEVKLGLIPAVISPYVVHALGPRVTTELFMSAEVFHAARALALQLVHYIVREEELNTYALTYAKKMTKNAPLAVQEAKALVRYVAHRTIDDELQHYTANVLAKKRLSEEGQRGIQAFLQKTTPLWKG